MHNVPAISSVSACDASRLINPDEMELNRFFSDAMIENTGCRREERENALKGECFGPLIVHTCYEASRAASLHLPKQLFPFSLHQQTNSKEEG